MHRQSSSTYQRIYWQKIYGFMDKPKKKKTENKKENVLFSYDVNHLNRVSKFKLTATNVRRKFKKNANLRMIRSVPLLMEFFFSGINKKMKTICGKSWIRFINFGTNVHHQLEYKQHRCKVFTATDFVNAEGKFCKCYF